MTYETAKKLKDAGYNFRYLTHKEKDPIGFPLGWSWYIPNLSELIEACQIKDKEFSLAYFFGRNKWIWQADNQPLSESDKEIFCAVADTPEEAVSNLFLRLNEKKD